MTSNKHDQSLRPASDIGEGDVRTKKKVLLVDDTADFRSLFRHALKSRPIELILKESALSAIEYLLGLAAQNAELPIITFVDLRMPELSGEDFVARVRGEPELSRLNIIVTSGWTGLREIVSRIGADGFLAKPFDLAKLYELVDGELAKLASR
jgi:CheY-like chemotaxis protein